MNAGSLISLLQSDTEANKYFRGIAWSDSVYNLCCFPTSLILNTDKTTGPGIHWCAVYFPNKTVCEYFDPFGLPPNVQNSHNFKPALFQNCEKIIFNKKQVQEIDETTCGQHCAYFLLLRSNNISFDEILNNYYTENLSLNDRLVRSYINQKLREIS
jgi:hypothetical protein